MSLTPPPQVGETISRLTDLCESEESSRAALHQKILRIIFSGVLQLFLAAIEDARREAEPVNLPRFSAFIKYLSAGSGNVLLFVTNHSLYLLVLLHYHIMHSYKELNCTMIVQLLSVLLFMITWQLLECHVTGGAVSALQEQWWEALEVSSNSQHKENLVDDNPSTSWESTGRSGTHWIRFHMKQGLIIK